MNSKERMDKIPAMIVDDEFPARENLRFLIETYCPEIEVVATAVNINSAETIFIEKRPLLLFLDIRMPSGAEGFELIHRLADYPFYVIFVTAYKDYAIRAFEQRALHYLLKPIDESDLREVVHRVTDRIENTQKDANEMQEYALTLKNLTGDLHRRNHLHRLTIHHTRGVKIVDPDQITWIQGSGNCSVLHFTDGSQYLDTRTLKIYEALLDYPFFRSHKSVIVNVTQVDEVLHGDNQAVVLKDGTRLAVARDKRKALIDFISQSGDTPPPDD